MSAMYSPSRTEPEVAWVCGTQTTYIASCAFLDKLEEECHHDDNLYTLGEIGNLKVVIAQRSQERLTDGADDGECGEAASVARDMLKSFQYLKLCLMVGIGGGAPNTKHDIRLGDVVVGVARGANASILQYDFGKSIIRGDFHVTRSFSQPPRILKEAVYELKTEYEAIGHDLEYSVRTTLRKNPRLQKDYQRPDHTSDRLYQSSVAHPTNDKSDCAITCGGPNLVLRAKRTKSKDNPAIHLGIIASASSLMTDACVRDKLAVEENILCFETEAAGLISHFPCLIIRGICDYSDTHRNKTWQGYASMTAAAYAKDLLGKIYPGKLQMERKFGDSLFTTWQGYVSMTAAAFVKDLSGKIYPGKLQTERKLGDSLSGEGIKEHPTENSHSQGPGAARMDRVAVEDVGWWIETEVQEVAATLRARAANIVYFALDFDDFFRCISDGPLEYFLTLTANSPTNAIAKTMREYVIWRWGTVGWDIVRWLIRDHSDTASSALNLSMSAFLQNDASILQNDAPNDVPIVELRRLNSTPTARIPQSLAAYQARRMGGERVKFDDVIAKLISELSWIVATFKTPGDTSPSFTKAKLEHNPFQEDYELCFRITHDEAPAEFSNSSKGTCWHSLFSGTNVAVGFPVPVPPDGMLGLELPLTLMADLAGVSYPVRYKKGLVLKGYNNALIPIHAEFRSGLSKSTKSLQWHLYSGGQERLYMTTVKKEEPDLQPLATKPDEAAFIETIEQIPRHFLGFYERATVRVGTNASRADHIRAIPDHLLNESRTRGLLEWTRTITASLGGGGMGLSGGISTGVRFRPWKERQMRFAQSIPDHSIIQDALTKPTILYDTRTKVAWMLPHIRVVLYLVQAWTKLHYPAECAKVDYPPFDENTTNVGELLRALELAWSQFPHIDFKQQFLWYCRTLDGLQDDEDLKPARRSSNMLAGVDFANLAFAPRDYSIFRVPVNPNVSGEWPQMLKSNWKDVRPYRVLTIFCNDLDPAPISPHFWMCSTWLHPPSFQNYLVATRPCLKTLAERHGTDPVKLSPQHECREGPSRLFQTCRTGICNPLQKIKRAQGRPYRELTWLLQGSNRR